MPTLKLTEQGTVTRLYENEKKLLLRTHSLLKMLAEHLPLVTELPAAVEQVNKVLEIFDVKAEEKEEDE